MCLGARFLAELFPKIVPILAVQRTAFGVCCCHLQKKVRREAVSPPMLKHCPAMPAAGSFRVFVTKTVRRKAIRPSQVSCASPAVLPLLDVKRERCRHHPCARNPVVK
jgi:hypothetical protein